MPHKNDNGEWIVPKRTQWAIIISLIFLFATTAWGLSEKLKARGIEENKTNIERMVIKVEVNTEFRIDTNRRLQNIERRLDAIAEKLGVANP